MSPFTTEELERFRADLKTMPADALTGHIVDRMLATIDDQKARLVACVVELQQVRAKLIAEAEAVASAVEALAADDEMMEWQKGVTPLGLATAIRNRKRGGP